jgi:hypothetical protein
MTRFKHDQFAKDLFSTIFEPFGNVKTDRIVQSETRRIDVFFTPTNPVPEDVSLSLLWKCAAQGAAFEAFRSPVRDWEVRSTMGKLFDVHGEIARQANSDKVTQPKTEELPRLWIITPTMSQEKLELANAITEEGWCSGFYFPGRMFCTGIIIANQLPKTPETVWFRMLGTGKVQTEAIAEISALSVGTNYREDILKLFASLQIGLQTSTERDSDEMELLMYLTKTPAFTEFVDRLRSEGMAEGLLLSRFSPLDEELSAIVPNIVQRTPSEFAPLLLQLSREELLDRFGNT